MGSDVTRSREDEDVAEKTCLEGSYRGTDRLEDLARGERKGKETK